MPKPHPTRSAPFALRVVQRQGGLAGVVYRRMADPAGRDRLQRLAALAPLAFTSAGALLRAALPGTALTPGPCYPLDADWGARLACFAFVSAGLRNGERLLRAAGRLREADPAQAAWWLGLLMQPDNVRALRALRILTEATQ